MTEQEKKAVYDELKLILEVLPKGIISETEESEYSKDWIDSNNQCISKLIVFVQQRALRYLPEQKEKVKIRFLVKFVSGYYKDEGCSHPDFPSWIIKNMLDRRLYFPHKDVEGHPKTDILLEGVIDAENEDQAWKRVKKFFPDYEMESIEVKPKDWLPDITTHPFTDIQPHCKP